MNKKEPIIKPDKDQSKEDDSDIDDLNDSDDDDINDEIDQRMSELLDELDYQITDDQSLFVYLVNSKKNVQEENSNYNDYNYLKEDKYQDEGDDGFNEYDDEFDEDDDFSDDGDDDEDNYEEVNTNQNQNSSENKDYVDELPRIYHATVDFIEELRKPISYEDSAKCFNHMTKLVNTINNLLDYQKRVPYDKSEIENWRNIMIQTLMITKSFFSFLKEEKNTKCIEIAESLIDFAFNVDFGESLESKIFSVLPEFGTFLNSNEPIFSLESSTGSGKTRCVPFFLSIRSYQENLAHPFIIMTQPSTNLIDSKVKDFSIILKNVTILTDVNDIINYGLNANITRPILCLLTPYNALILIEKAKKSGVDLFNRSRWVLDEVHDRTVFIDTIIGFLHQELDTIENFPCQITLMTATMDKSIQLSLGKTAKNIALKDFTPYYVRETIDSNNDIRDIPLIATEHLFSILEEMRCNKIEPGHILIFVAGNADCQIILRNISSRAEMNNETNERKIMYIHVTFNEFTTEEMIYQDIEREAFNPDYLYILPIQLAGYVSYVQKSVAQNPLPKNLKNVIKIIVSTNIIESSITILDLAAVIDSGLYNRAKFDSETEITKITKESISKKMATQRRGRVGRTRKGVYVGISTGIYQDIEPQIRTSDLSTSLLSLRNIGIKLEKVAKLPDEPDFEQIENNITNLTNIGALDIRGNITQKGREISLLTNDFSPFFASVLLDIRMNTNSEYCEILAALVILIITSQQLVFNQQCPALQKNYDKSSDIITILRTFNEIFEENYQDQKEKCVQYGIDQINYTRLITSFSNFIHRIFKRESDDYGFLGRHMKEIRKLISSINLTEFVNFVILSISKTKPKWLSERTFTFAYVSGLEHIPSVIATNQITKKTVIIGSRPGWRGLECDDNIFVFSLIARNQTIFGTIVHRCPYFSYAPMFKCISFEFNDNISLPFFSELLRCMNTAQIFLPLNIKKTNQNGSLTTLYYQSSWMNSNYLTICTKDERNVIIMKKMINDAKLMMPFIGKSLLADVPDVSSIVEIYSIGGSQYSTKIYSLNDHPYAYEFNEKMFYYLFKNMSDLAKTDSPLRIAININYILCQIGYDVNPFIVISNNEIPGFNQIDWSNLIKPMQQRNVNKFIEDVNSIAPNIINAKEVLEKIYCFMGKSNKLSDVISNLLNTNFKDDKLVKKITINKLFYGEDIDYDIESSRIKKEISQNQSKIRKIKSDEKHYNSQFQRFNQYKSVDYPKLLKSYKRRMKKYNKAIKDHPDKKLKKPKKPKTPTEPKKPDFNKNKQTIESCDRKISNLQKELVPIENYFQSRNKLINDLHLHQFTSNIKTCGSDGCIISINSNGYIPIRDTQKWKCDRNYLYDITITHHVFHSMDSTKFKEIVKNTADKFGIFVNRISQYCIIKSFGQLGYITVQIMGKQLVIPFINTILDELDKGATLKSSHDFELPQTIISNTAITHPANNEYFIKLMRKNKIDVTLEGSIVSGKLNEVRNAFQLINQRRIELLFPFLSIKIPKCIFAGRIDEQISQANSTRPPNKHWVKMKSELVCPREDLKECQSIINSLAGQKKHVHGCIYFCDDPQYSNRYLPVYIDQKTPVLRPLCVNCLKETLHYATNNFFDSKLFSFSKEFLENNIEMIPSISICEDKFDKKTSETWPIVPFAQLFYVLQYNIELAPMSNAWIKGVTEQTIRTCPSIITSCPDHPQKKFLMGDIPIHCMCESCKLCFCVSCKSWHDPSNMCEKLDSSLPHCPKCGIPTFKNEGCNHIQCKCGAHWCYKCGAGPFTDGSQCYAHMSKVHNSFVD